MPAEPIRVVHLVAGLGAGGAEKQLFLLCSHSPQQVQHTVVTMRGGIWMEPLRQAGVSVHSFDERTITGLRNILRITRLLRKLRPAVLHCWLPSMNLLGTLAARLSGVARIRVVASVRNVDDWMPRWRIMLQRAVARWWDAAICNSFGGYEWCQRSGLPAHKLRVIPNGILPQSPRTKEEYFQAREALGLAKDAFVVVCANRLVPQKRMDRVLEAARRLPDCKFVIAGDGPLRDHLNSLRPDNVYFLGHLDNTRRLLTASDVFLMTSDREGTSNSLLEAMQAGCAIVATPAGDNARILSGGAGLIAEPDQISVAIQYLRDNEEERESVAAVAARRARDFTVDRMVQRTTGVYRELADLARIPHRTPVLFLDYTNNIGMGGGQRSLLLLLRNLDRDRYKPVVACPPDERLLEFVQPDVSVRSLDLPRRFRSASRRDAGLLGAVLGTVTSIPAILRLRRIIIGEKIGLIHANNLKMLLLGAVAARGTRVPVVWHLRDILPHRPEVKLMHAVAVRLADKVLAVSRAVADQLGAAACVNVLYNAVEMPATRNRDTRRNWRLRHGIPEDAFVVGYAGRLDPGKGVDVLVDAVASACRNRLGDTWLVIVGEGPERRKIEQKLLEAGLRGRTVLAGFQQNLDDAWAAMDVAVTPSVEPDSFPRSVIEAMSHGLPVIGSNVGGIAEAIEHGRSGLCVPAADVQALGQAIETLAHDRPRAQRMGASGRARCMEHFTANRQSRELSEVYESLLARQGGA
jgi:glycosyltransferase involved in cell wall biosynthesis